MGYSKESYGPYSFLLEALKDVKMQVLNSILNVLNLFEIFIMIIMYPYHSAF